LAKNGADLSMKNKAGQTVLYLSLLKKRGQVVGPLLEIYGASITVK